MAGGRMSHYGTRRALVAVMLVLVQACDGLSERSDPAGVEAAPAGGLTSADDTVGADGSGRASPGSGFADMGAAGDGQSSAMTTGGARQSQVLQALAGLEQIRQRQCQMGNQLACQELPRYPGYQQQLAQADQGCRSGNSDACSQYNAMAQRFQTAYSESAAVMQAGDAATAQMNNWRAQMNRNADASMAALNARAAAGQAAHEARQEMYDGMNRRWAEGQASADRAQGRRIDSIYEGTTMNGGGVQTRIPYGSTGYTDGFGNIVAVPNGSAPPDGWQRMTETYRAPQ